MKPIKFLVYVIAVSMIAFGIKELFKDTARLEIRNIEKAGIVEQSQLQTLSEPFVEKAYAQPQTQEKAHSEPENKPEKKLTWQDNPQECNTTTHWIDKNEPFKCIKKATEQTVTDARPVTGGGNIEQIVRDAAVRYGLNPDTFVAMAMCESGMNPNAINYSYYENGHPSGLLQHLSGYWPARAAAHGYAGASVFDPVANANVSAAMIASGARGLWEC